MFRFFKFQSLIEVKTQEEQNVVPSVDAIVTTRVLILWDFKLICTEQNAILLRELFTDFIKAKQQKEREKKLIHVQFSVDNPII